MIPIILIKASITATEAGIKIKKHAYRNNGLPSKVITDRDYLFRSKLWKALFESLGTNLATLSPIILRPMTNPKSPVGK